MRVFISWSGDQSKNVAQLLKEWIENVLQHVQVWISPEIDKGVNWFAEIANQLESTSVGIICITPDNISAPWMLFEAGALWKGAGQSHVMPLLIGLNPTDLKPPLSQFNATTPDEKSMLKLIQTINEYDKDRALPKSKLDDSFNRWWDTFRDRYKSITSQQSSAPAPPKRSTDDMVAELLEISRSMQRMLIRRDTITVESAIEEKSPGTRFRKLVWPERHMTKEEISELLKKSQSSEEIPDF
jgi:hypothetical protein